MKLPSGGKSDLGAATAGEMELSIFQKRPDPKRKPTVLGLICSQKIILFIKAKINVLWVVNNQTRLELNCTRETN